MPEISVIVPVYNTEKYLRRCIDSILAQTFTDFELILVDDGSTDGSRTICEEYAASEKRITVIHKHNGGAGAARNTGVELSNSDYICFIDADDIVHPKMLERLYKAIKESGAGIALCRTITGEECPREFYHSSPPVKIESKAATEGTVLSFYNDPFWCWVVWGKLIQASIVKKNLFAENRYHEDTVVIQWLLEARLLTIVDETLYFYRQNMQGVSKGSLDAKKAVDGIWAVCEQLNFVRERKYKKLEEQYIPRFLYESAKAYFVVKDEDRKLAREIKNKAFFEWIKSGRAIQYKPGEKAFVMEMFFPLIMWVYWRIKRRDK